MSGLKRCTLYVRPYVIQFPGSLSAWMILSLSTSLDCLPAAGLVCDVFDERCLPHPRQATMAIHKLIHRNEGRKYSLLPHLGLTAPLRNGMLHTESKISPGTHAKENSLLSYRQGPSMSSVRGRIHIFFNK